MNKKQLLERIKSLEDFLGVVYSNPIPEIKDTFGEHYAMRWGELPRMSNELEALTKKTFPNKFKD
jgi:hypothetical protein